MSLAEWEFQSLEERHHASKPKFNWDNSVGALTPEVDDPAPYELYFSTRCESTAVDIGRGQSMRKSLGFGWLGRAIDLGPDKYDVDLLADVYAEMDRALHHRQFVRLDLLLNGLSLDRLSPEILVTVLRATFRAKPKLPQWADTIEKFRSSLEQRGIDSKRALRGIL
jgi:hypothetical protein